MKELSEIRDVDGNLYSFAHVGDFLWSTSNLKVTKFNSGVKLNFAKSFEDWELFLNSNQPAYCYYEFNEKYKDKFGALYNKFVLLNDENSPLKDIAPKGCSIPNDFVLEELKGVLGAKECASYIKSKNMWQAVPQKRETGIDIVPSGFLDGLNEEFADLGSNATFGMLGGRMIFSIIDNNNHIEMDSLDYYLGFSLRFVKRSSFTSSTKFEKLESEIPFWEQIDIEFFNGINCLDADKRNSVFDLIAVLLITTPLDIRKSHIDLLNIRFKKSPFDELSLDIQNRISFVAENQLDNNLIFTNLAEFNLNLSEFEAFFISMFINRYLFPASTIKSFDLADSNNFLMILSVVNKLCYLKGIFPLFIDPKDKVFIQNIISQMSFHK